MNMSAVAIRRPVFTTMCAAGLLVLGVVGLTRLGTDLFPDVSFPMVAVAIPYPGASPAEVETLVTRPVEDAVISLNGIDRVRSFSREGLSTTLVIFKLHVNAADAATQVRERVSQARYKLPRDVLEPTVNRFDISAAAILTYTLRGQRPLSEIRKFAEDVVKPALEQVDGVASVEVKGGAAREITVKLDRARADALGLAPALLVQRLQLANLTVPGGRLEEGTREVSVRTLGELGTAEAVRQVIVASGPDGSAVRLSDVAEVEDGFEEMRTLVRVNGQDAVTFDVFKQSGSNTVAVSDGVAARLAQLQLTFPADIKPAVIVEQARFVKENAHEVEVAILFGGAMAILIILIFMLDLRSTLISAVALPTSVIGTFFAMYALGYTLNMMTLLGLSLAIGLLIDDAVVVRENIFKHLERGKDPFRAAQDGTQEISLSVLATTLTIVAVFLPVAFVEGIVGQFFRQFGITVSVSVLLSLVVAFTLDPMLSARFSRNIHDKSDRFHALKRPFEAFFRALDETYRALLTWCVHHKLAVGGASLGSLALMGWVGLLMGTEFMASEDRGQFLVQLEFPGGTSLVESSRLSALGEAEVMRNPHFRTLFVTVGPDGEANKVAWRVVTTNKEERTVPITALKDLARRAAAALPQASVNVSDPAIVEGAQAEAPIMVNVRGPTYEDVAPLAERVADILKTTPGVQDVELKYSPGKPELQLSVDRQRAADMGLSVAQVAMGVRSAMEGQEAGKMRQGKDEIPIKVRYRPDDRATEEALAQLTLPTQRGLVRLGDVATFVRGASPQVIEREDRARQIQVWAAPRGRPLGDIVDDMEPRLRELALPVGGSITYDGQIRLMNETNTNMGLALLLGVLFIYLVLASQFESFIHPITIMLTLPLALVGAVLSLFLTNNTLAMGAIIGIILLMGLVTKNAILLIDRAIVHVREHGDTPLQAVLKAGPERLRPILMTSAAMVLGMAPTAFNTGEGSEFRAPMAIAIIGGVVSSTMLSLVVVPVFYLVIEGAKARLARWLGLPQRRPGPVVDTVTS
ncbi:MAG: efflux RND transporter permease subunit [Deltaproteobacteria bacterium]|nr:efflux RND transporter permease subunit [Deltaproteobacteria bacterium]